MIEDNRYLSVPMSWYNFSYW